jgi:predicted PurR-regulated permease PerM
VKKYAVYGFLCVSVILLLISIIGLGSALTPLLCAWALSYFCIPLFKLGERYGVPKTVSAFSILLLIVCMLIALLFIFIPYVISELQFFLSDFPQFVVGFIKQVTTELAAHDIHIEIDDFSLLSFIKAHLPKVSAKSLLWVGSAFQSALSNIIILF